LSGLRVVALDIKGGSAKAVTAGRIAVDHDLVVGDGFTCDRLRLPSSNIGGDLNLTGACLRGGDEWSALNFDGARVGGRVYLRAGDGNEFVASRKVSGQNARVDGGILCTSASFGSGLDLTRSQVGGEVSLKNAAIGGRLSMSAMDIDNDLTLEGTSIADAGAEFVRTRVGGSFVWKPSRLPDQTQLARIPKQGIDTCLG
jgi:hypothetical protein